VDNINHAGDDILQNLTLSTRLSSAVKVVGQEGLIKYTQLIPGIWPVKTSKWEPEALKE